MELIYSYVSVVMVLGPEALHQWHALERLAKRLKGVLKAHSGEKAASGSDLDRDLRVYTKIKKLSDRIKAGKDETQRINEYYLKLIPQKSSKKVKGAGEDIKEERESKEPEDVEEDIQDIVIGPTPQLQGRIVDLLSIEVSPEVKVEIDDDKGTTAAQETPSKSIQPEIMETPACFKKRLQFDDSREFSFDPSPIFKGNGRSIFALNKEVKSLKRNLSQLLEDERLEVSETSQEIDDAKLDGDVGGEGNNEAKPEDTDLNAYKIKHKTIKRSTRRVKMKTQKDINEDDMFEEKQLHAFVAHNSASDVVSEESEDISSEEETYERMDFSHIQPTKSTGKHPLSNNFVRMKIHKKGPRNGGRFRRR